MIARNRNIDLMQSGLIQILALNLLITFAFADNISVGGHLGGLAGGLVATFVVEELGKRRRVVDDPGRDLLRVDRCRRRGGVDRDRQLAASSSSRTPPAGSGSRSGCSAWASHSSPSTSRGPGRENQAEASATTIRSAPSAASRSE